MPFASAWLSAALFLGAAVAVPVAPTDEPTPLPAATRVCVAPAGAVGIEDVRGGRCPSAATAPPGDAWLALELPPGAGRVVLSTTDIFTIKRGSFEVWVADARSVTVRASDPPAQRPWYDGRLVLPVEGSPSAPTSVWVRLAVRDSRQLASPEAQVLIATADGALRHQVIRWFWQGAFIGLTLIMALYNAFLSRAERFAAAGWYCFLLLALALYFAVARLMLPLLPLPGIAQAALAVHPCLAPLAVFAGLGFVRSYANVGPRGDRLLRGFMALNVLVGLAALVLDPLGHVALAATIVNVVSASSVTVALVAAARSAYRGDGPSRVIVGTTLAPILGTFVQVGVMAGLLPSYGWGASGLQLALTLQIVLLAFALAGRIRRLRVDRDQAEAVLRLTLPDAIAYRLKAGETSIADRHARVAVLFADLAGFTPMSASRDPETIVRMLDALFSELDTLAHRVGAEKIKTIGDCYMVAAGAPTPHADPAGALAELALELPAATERAMRKLHDLAPDLPERLPFRIGLHVGPVVAGVLGHQKLAYDLWGDTVNTASRMESHGVIGRVQCTREVVELLQERYVFESRGEVNIRGKGRLDVWLLVGRRAAGALS